jgi:hypothetical protein
MLHLLHRLLQLLPSQLGSTTSAALTGICRTSPRLSRPSGRSRTTSATSGALTILPRNLRPTSPTLAEGFAACSPFRRTTWNIRATIHRPLLDLFQPYTSIMSNVAASPRKFCMASSLIRTGPPTPPLVEVDKRGRPKHLTPSSPEYSTWFDEKGNRRQNPRRELETIQNLRGLAATLDMMLV